MEFRRVLCRSIKASTVGDRGSASADIEDCMPVFEPIAKGSAEQPPRNFGSGRPSMRISALQANARTAVRSTMFASYKDRCCHHRYASPPSHQRCFPRSRPAERMKRSEENTSELTSIMPILYDVVCL